MLNRPGDKMTVHISINRENLGRREDTKGMEHWTDN